MSSFHTKWLERINQWSSTVEVSLIKLVVSIDLHKLNGSIVVPKIGNLIIRIDHSSIKKISDGASIDEVGFKVGTVAGTGEGRDGAGGGALRGCFVDKEGEGEREGGGGGFGHVRHCELSLSEM